MTSPSRKQRQVAFRNRSPMDGGRDEGAGHADVQQTTCILWRADACIDQQRNPGNATGEFRQQGQGICTRRQAALHRSIGFTLAPPRVDRDPPPDVKDWDYWHDGGILTRR